MTGARKAANLKRVEVEWIRMRHKEQLSEEFNNQGRTPPVKTPQYVKQSFCKKGKSHELCGL